MSAHHYFRDFAYCDSGIIPWLLIAELVSRSGRSLGDWVKDRFAAFPSSGEMSFKVHCSVPNDASKAINRQADDYNLNTIGDMAKRFGVITGLSDHTLDNATAIASVALGASIIEKHFTLDRNGGGPDDSFSLEPDTLRALCRDSKTAWHAMGRIEYGQKSSELGNAQFRRSLYYVKDLRVGDVITPESVKSVRPGYGIRPKNLSLIMGRRLLIDVDRHTAVRWEHINGLFD